MELVTIAKPYAKAVFDIATQNKEHEQWREVLTEGARIVSDKSMQALFALVALGEAKKACIDLSLTIRAPSVKTSLHCSCSLF
jgi:F0F1-type ATP synthase delta subunit